MVRGQALLLGDDRRCLMQQLPFAGIAEQRIAFVEVACAEGLQRVLLGHCVEQRLIIVGVLPAAGQVVAQLADQYRGRAITVVTDAAAYPADVQLVTG